MKAGLNNAATTMSWHDPGPKEISLAIICFAAAALIGAYNMIAWLLL